MEDITDSDEHSDTIMLVEEDTVLEVLSEIEENTSENSYEDRQLPTMITHGKMTIRTARNANENINEKLKLIKSLEHPMIRNQRLDRRNTYKNLKITKDKQDEYDKIMRNASDFISGIFPNASNLNDKYDNSFDNKYMKTDEMISVNDNINFPHKIDDINPNEEFTVGTFRNSDNKIAEHMSTLQKSLISKSKTVDFNLNLQTSPEKKMKTFSRTKHENLFTIEEADKTMLEGDNEQIIKSLKDDYEEKITNKLQERHTKVSKVHNDVNTTLHNNSDPAQNICSENLEANDVRSINDSCQPNIGKDEESIQTLTCHIEKSIQFDYEEDRKTIEARELNDANIWDEESDEQIIQAQTEECCSKIQYDGFGPKPGNEPISMHYELLLDDNINVDKDTCIETEYENERQRIEKYYSMVELKIIDCEKNKIFSNNEDLDVGSELIVDCIEAEYLDALELINETDGIVFDQIFSSPCTNYDKDQPENANIGEKEQEIHINHINQNKQISIESKILGEKNDYKYETHMNDIIEQNYKEIEENIIDTENTKLSELFEQAASNNIDNVNKDINLCLFKQPEYIREATEKYCNPDTYTSSVSPTSLYVHMVANYNTSENFTNLVDVKTNQPGQGWPSMISHSGRDGENRERYSEVSHRTSGLIDELLIANDHKDEGSKENSFNIEELVICEDKTKRFDSKESASLAGEETIPIKILVDVTKLINIPRNKSQTIAFEHDDKQNQGETINVDGNDSEANQAKTGKVITTISENLSKTNTDENETGKAVIDPKTKICIRGQLNTKHREEEIVPRDNKKDAWTSIHIIIQSEDAQQDNFRNIPINIERTHIQSEENGLINIPIDKQREQNNKKLNEDVILDKIVKIPITIQPNKIQTDECIVSRNIFRNIPINIQTDSINKERYMRDADDWMNIPLQQEKRESKTYEIDRNNTRDNQITLGSEEIKKGEEICPMENNPKLNTAATKWKATMTGNEVKINLENLIQPNNTLEKNIPNASLDEVLLQKEKNTEKPEILNKKRKTQAATIDTLLAVSKKESLINVYTREIKKEIEDPMSNIPTTNQEELCSIDSVRDGCTNVPTKVISVYDQIDGFRNIPIIIEGGKLIREKQESKSSPLQKGNNEETDTVETNARQETIIDLKEAANIESLIHQAMIQMDKTVDILEVSREILDTKESREIITEMKEIKNVLSALYQTGSDESNLENCVEDKPEMNILRNPNVKKDNVHILNHEHETTLLLHEDETRRVLQGGREISDEKNITKKLHEINTDIDIHRATVIVDQIEDPNEHNTGMKNSMKIKEVCALPKSKLENETCKSEIESLYIMGKEEVKTGIEQNIPLIDKTHQLINIGTETIDPKKTEVTCDKNVTSAMHQVEQEKYRNKELEDKEEERKEITNMKDTKNASQAIPHRKLLTDKTQELPDDTSGVSRQSLISKIEKNIQAINLYERRIQSIGQIIIEHESSCLGNIENEKVITQDLKMFKTKQTDKSQKSSGQEKVIQASIQFFLFLLLGLVLVFLTQFSPMPLSCSEDVENIGSAPASCALDGYLQLESGAFM